MPEITLRDAAAADIPALYKLDLLCFDEPFRFDVRSMRRFVAHPASISVIAEKDGVTLGFIILALSRRGTLQTAYITTLDVHPDHRRAGLAGKLIVEAERRAVLRGATIVTLHVFSGNAAAISFYEAAGYERVSAIKGFYGPRLDALVYLKLLPHS